MILAVLGKVSFAQQDPMYTHYMYNTLAVNPAYAGTRNALTATALNRSQWVGFDGAPVTQTFILHTPLFNEKIGVGGSVINDRIGPAKMTGIFGDFSYHIKLNGKGKLAFGLKGGINMYTLNLTKLQTDQQGDVSFSSNLYNKSVPNFGFGMYYYRERFYAGLSIPKLLQNNYSTSQPNGSANLLAERRHYFFITGAVFNLSPSLQLKPTALIKATTGAPVEADFTAQFILDKALHIGAMYRTGDAAGILVGYNILEQLYAGYSFDWSFLNQTIKFNSGSHELMRRYDFIYKTKEKIKSPRYF